LSLPRHILSVAPNCCLRATREEIFKTAGYAVTSLSSTSEALRKLSGNGFAFDIVVVCDCIPADDRSRFIATVKATSPTIPILLIGEGRELLITDAVRGLDGPEALLNHVAGLMVLINFVFHRVKRLEPAY
jgi:DNA-binding NtrC family response regulator